MTQQRRIFGAACVLTLLGAYPLGGQTNQAKSSRVNPDPGSAAASHFLRLKSRVIDTEAVAGDPSIAAKSTKAQKSVISDGRVHLIAQLGDSPLDQPALTARGVTILGYIPDNGVAVSAPAGADLSGLGFRWIGPIEAADRRGFPIAQKMSADADPSDSTTETPGYYVAQFYSDVDMLQAAATVAGLGIATQPNSSLLTTQLLAIGTPDQMVALTAYDIVEYVFPASPELIQGIPVVPCVSGETSYGPTMAMAAALAGGWSEDANGVANLTFSLGPLPANISPDTILALFMQAQQQWGTAVLLNFTQITNETASRNVDLGFYSYAHGDSYPFDGPGGVLAHTFFPSPPNQEPIAGDMHLDASENWTTDGSGGTDFYSVALHELGHALGMNHTTGPLDVMYPFYRKNVTFSPTDIAQIQSMYTPQTASVTPPVTTFPTAPLAVTVQVPSNQVSAPTTSLSGTTTGGQGTVQVTWSTDRGALGTAQGSTNWTVDSVTLAKGMNTITVTATDQAANTASQSIVVTYTTPAPPPSLTPPPATTPPAPVIQITSPAGGVLATTSMTADIQGTATTPAGIKSISWQASTGASGVAQGTSSWDTGPIGLQNGVNVVTINALGLDGGTSSTTAQITVSTPQSPPVGGGGGGGGGGGTDTTPPTLTIQSPSTTSVYTSDATITITGTATDNVGVTSVRWDGLLGGAVASGTTNWSTGPIPLLVGMNNIVIHAYDAAGNSSWRSVTVTKQ